MELLKNKLSNFALVLVFLVGSFSYSFSFEGTWINQQAIIPKLQITQKNNNLLVSAWEMKAGSLYALGTVYGRYAATNSRSSDQTLKASFDSGKLSLQLSLKGERMKVHIFDGYSRFEYTFYKKNPVLEGNWNGSISGEILGPAKSTASIFQILLYGPDNGNRLLKRQALGRNKAFSFEGLPDGTYWMLVKARGVTRILPFPSEKKIIIRNGEAIHQDVELK